MAQNKFYQGDALDKELRALYEEKGKLPDMTHLERRRRRRVTNILIGLVIFFAILTLVSWLGFFLFNPSQNDAEGRVRIEGTDAVISGVPTEVTIVYENRDTEPLAFSSLRLRVPRGLRIISASPESDVEGRLEWNFGSLPANTQGKIQLQVVPYELQDERLDLIAILQYKPSNFNAEFQTTYTHSFNIRETGLRMLLTGPTQANPGQTIALRATIENVSSEIFEGVRTTLIPSEEFTLETAQPQNTGNQWSLGTLNPGEIKEIELQGSFLSNAQGVQTLAIQTETGPENSAFVFARAEHQLELKSAALDIALVVNESPHLEWVRTLETLQFKLTVNNRGDEAFENASVRLMLSGGLLNFNEAEALNGLIIAGTVSFPKEGALTLNPGEPQEFTARIPVGGTELRTLSPLIEAHAEVSYQGTTVRTAPIKLIVVSDLKLDTQARYFETAGRPAGSGPLPPKVGEETRFEMRLRLTNSFHDLSKVVVIAPLPQGVRFTGRTQVEAGTITFNETSREVKWEIPRLPVTVPQLSAQFEIGITPQESERAKLLLLLGVSRAEALDTISQVTFSTDAPSVSSSLEFDPEGKGKGVVE